MNIKNLIIKEGVYRAPLETVFTKIKTPFEEFLHNQKSSGFLLILMTIIALFIANSSYGEAYAHILHTKVGISIGELSGNLSIHHIINDGLMALFFFLVGLEIKREFMNGELSDFKNATLPVFAAFGGMIVPALIFLSINYGTPYENGWGIPMATDIAFALTAIMLIASKVPKSLVTFLVAFAIVDDLGAVAVISIFYTETINFEFFAYAIALFLLLILINRFGIFSMAPYIVIGIAMWFMMLNSGIHATVAGILTAMTIPSYPKFNPKFYGSSLTNLKDAYDKVDKVSLDKAEEEVFKLTEKQKSIINCIEETSSKTKSPLSKMEHALHLPVGIVLIPLFALANAGVLIHFDKFPEIITHSVSIGIMLGLILGKAIGIFSFSYFAVKSRIGRLPINSNWTQLFGISVLGGVGFTMSIFITELAFKQMPEVLAISKISIMTSSLIAIILAIIILLIGNRLNKNTIKAEDNY